MEKHAAFGQYAGRSGGTIGKAPPWCQSPKREIAGFLPPLMGPPLALARAAWRLWPTRSGDFGRRRFGGGGFGAGRFATGRLWPAIAVWAAVGIPI